jgi:hypothetical protein
VEFNKKDFKTENREKEKSKKKKKKKKKGKKLTWPKPTLLGPVTGPIHPARYRFVASSSTSGRQAARWSC